MVSGERPVEGGVGFVAGPSCDLLGRFPGTQQELAGQFHPELGQVRHRRLPENTGEPLGEGGPASRQQCDVARAQYVRLGPATSTWTLTHATNMFVVRRCTQPLGAQRLGSSR